MADIQPDARYSIEVQRKNDRPRHDIFTGEELSRWWRHVDVSEIVRLSIYKLDSEQGENYRQNMAGL